MAGTIQRLYRSDSESIPQDEMAPVTQNAARLKCVLGGAALEVEIAIPQ